jgi:hypothetical protein
MQHPPRQRLSSNALLVICYIDECNIANARFELLSSWKRASA